MKNKIILTDADGVLLDWEYAFDVWMTQHGFNKLDSLKYNIGKRYGIEEDQGRKLIKIFNESAHIGFLPPLRDAMYYVKRLHEEHGYVFHCITSLTKDENAQELRRMNLRKLFGITAFEKFVFLDTGADKDQALEPYRDSGLWWIEDKIDNCQVGTALGLKSLLVEHGHNMHYNDSKIPRMKNWRDIYNMIVVGSLSPHS
jgi:FMN phosphatase YigB (HAD superfamily)